MKSMLHVAVRTASSLSLVVVACSPVERDFTGSGGAGAHAASTGVGASGPAASSHAVSSVAASSAVASTGTGPGCTMDADCVADKSDICTNGTCASSCSDNTQDGTETYLDCGGACPPCKDGATCNVGSDCQSSVCTGGLCVSLCTNGVKDGAETDVDCGDQCPPCMSGQTCLQDSDCEAGLICMVPFQICL